MATNEQERALEKVLSEVVFLPPRDAISVMEMALKEVKAAAEEYEKRLGY
jgi:hypothetical protein